MGDEKTMYELMIHTHHPCSDSGIDWDTVDNEEEKLFFEGQGYIALPDLIAERDALRAALKAAPFPVRYWGEVADEWIHWVPRYKAWYCGSQRRAALKESE